MRNTIKSTLYLTLAVMAAGCAGGEKDFDATGVFEAEEITVSSEGNGRLLFCGADEGDKVEEGETLAQIDTVQLHYSKMQIEAGIASAESGIFDVDRQVASLTRQIEKQESDLKRFTRLVESGAAGQKQVDDLKAQIAVSKSQLAAQKESLRNSNSSISGKTASLRAQLAQTEDLIAKCTVKSPVSGTVLARYAHRGELTATGRPLFKVADTDNLKLRAYVTASQFTKLRNGQDVKVFVDYGEKDRREYSGRVVWISEEAEFTPKTIQTRDERSNLVYAVKIAVKNDGLIKIGMYGEVKF